MKRKEIKKEVLKWADNKNLLGKDHISVLIQSLKLISEVGELSDAIIKKDFKETVDAIGDIQVVLIILCDQLGLKIDECLESAYNEIKERTGKTVNGVFIKNE